MAQEAIEYRTKRGLSNEHSIVTGKHDIAVRVLRLDRSGARAGRLLGVCPRHSADPGAGRAHRGAACAHPAPPAPTRRAARTGRRQALEQPSLWPRTMQLGSFPGRRQGHDLLPLHEGHAEHQQLLRQVRGSLAGRSSPRAPPQAGDGVDASLLGTTTRKDGTTQVTYNGWPLYYYVKDQKPGDVTGQDVGDVWYVLSPRAR